MASEGWSIDPQNPNRAVYTDAEGNVLQEAFKDEAVAQPKVSAKNKTKVAPVPAPIKEPVAGASRVQPTAAAPLPLTTETNPYGQMGADEEALFKPDALRIKPQRLDPKVEREYYAEIARNKNNPNFSQKDIDAFWTSRGYAPMQASEEFIGAVRKGEDTGRIDYSSWDAQQQALEDERMRAAREDFAANKAFTGDYASAVDEAAQSGFWGIVSREMQDIFDSNKEELRKQFPQASEEELEELADKDIIRKGRAALQHYEENNKDSAWLPWLGGQFTGSLDPTALIAPGSSAAGRIGGNVAVSTGTEGLFEGLKNAQGLTDQMSPENILMAGLFGGTLQGGIEGGSALLNRLRSRVKTPEQITSEAGSPISSEEFQALGERLGVATDEEVAAAFTPGEVTPEDIRAFTAVEDPEVGAPNPAAPEAMSDRMLMERGELPPADVTVRDDNPTAPARIDVEEKVAELTKDWKNSPEFEIVDDVAGIADPAIRDAVDDPSIVGFYGPDGKVRIIANNLSSVDDVKPAIFHESLGHHGMRQKFGDELDNFMTRLHKNSPELRAAVDEWKAANEADYGNIPLATQVEEVLAGMSEEGPLSRTIIDRVKDWLKNFARSRMGMDLEFSPREVKSILAQAHQMVTEGTDTGARGDGVRFIKAFHVSPNNFERFDRRFRGKGEGAQAYGQGHYFTESPDVADSYRDFFTSSKMEIDGKPASTQRLFDRLQDNIWANNTHLQSNMIGQNVIANAQEMSWSAAQLAANKNKAPTPEELLEHLKLDKEDKGLLAAARIVSKELGEINFKSDKTKPTTFEVELPDDGKWIVRDEPIAAQSDLRKVFEDDGFDFRSRDDIDDLKRELRDLEYEIKWAPERDVMRLEEQRSILEDRLANAIPDDLRADDLEPELASHGMSDQDVADWLESKGFTGFKYKDGFSRSGKKVTPTYNYVVFGDDVPVITNKYMRRQPKDRKPIDLNRIRNTKDLNAAIHDLTEEWSFEPQTHEETRELAEAYAAKVGLTPQKIARRKVVNIEQAPEYMAAIGEIMVAQEAKVRELAKKIADGADDSATLQEATTELAKLGSIVPQAMRFNSAAGRALNAVGMLKRAGRGPQQILEQLESYANIALDRDTILKLMAKVNQLEDPADVAKLAGDAFNPRAEDYIFSAWYNINLLSRLSTQMNNIIGTSGHLAAELSSQHIAWALGLPKKLTGNTNRIATRELVARWAGVASGVLQGLSNASKAFELGMPVSGPSKEAYRPLPIMEAATNFNSQGFGSKLPRVLQNTVNEAAIIAELPSRMMAVTDEFFRSVASLSDYYGRAARDVLSDLDGGEGTLGERFYSLTRMPTEEMKKAEETYAVPINERRNINLAGSHELSRRVTFRDELTDFGKGVEDILRTKEGSTLPTRVGKFSGRVMVPFYRMGERMLAAINRYTPGTGLASRVNREGLASGGADRDIALGRQLFGVGLGLLAAQQALSGQRSGEGPSDYERRMELEASGWRPNSVLMDDGTWFKTDNLDPINAFMNGIATAIEQYEEGILEDEGYLSKAEDLTNAFIKWAGSAAGLENIFRMMGGVEARDDAGASNAKAGILGSFVTPGFMQAYTQNFDDTKVRSTSGDKSIEDRVSGRVQSAFPSGLAEYFGRGGSKDLPQRFNPFGEGMTRKGGWLGFLFGDRFSDSTQKTAVKEVVRLGNELKGKPVVGLPDRTLQLGSGENRITKKLTEEEYQMYVNLSGHWFTNGFTNEMNKPEYKTMSDADKRAMIKDIASQARKAAREYLFIREVEEEPETVDPLVAALEADANAQPIAIPEGNDIDGY